MLKNGKVLTEGGHSLKNELADFIDCVKTGKAPSVGANETRDIVKLCLKLEKDITINEYQKNCRCCK